MMNFPLRSAVGALSMALASLAQAQDSGITHKISGYGTVAGTFTDTNDAEYAGSLTKFTGARKQVDTGVDSRLGLQGVVTFDPLFSMTAQALMIRRQAKDFDVGLEWFYGQYSPIPEVNVRLGRVMIPAFLVSDSINVGYSQPWMRAPNEVYAQMLINTLDGVQISGRKSFGSLVLNGQIATGKSSFSVLIPGVGPLAVPLRQVVNTSISAEYDNWLARVGQTRTHSENGNVTDEFSTVGMQFDNGTAVVMAEAAQRKNTLTVYEAKSWYVAGGWRFGKLLPMVSFGKLTPDNDNPVTRPNKSVGVSARYDVASNVALKVQVNRAETAAAVFVNKTASAPAKATVAALGLDFVF